MSQETKAVKLPSFDGAHKTFQVWWMRYQAYACVYKFIQALAPGGEPEMPASQTTVLTTDAAGKASAAALNRNSVAMATLTMAFTNETNMGLVFKSCSTDWPGGLAHIVVQSLFKKYKPQDTITRVELRQQLNKVSMKRSDDPAILFNQISTIQNQFNTMTQQIQEDELIAIVLATAPKDYQAVLTSEQCIQKTNLTMDDLETVMNQHWRQIGGKKESQEDDDNELSLSAFNGTCFNCGKKGHKSPECRSPKKSKNGNGNGTGYTGKFSGTCNNCGKQGLKSETCWMKEENKEKRPA